MAKISFFNKATLRGKLTSSKVVDYESKTDKKKGHFLSTEVNTGGTNKVKASINPTKANPNKDKELNESYPVNSNVIITGSLAEREYVNKVGKKVIDRTIKAYSITSMADDVVAGAFFILQGIVSKIKKGKDGVEVTVRYDETYEDSKTKKDVTKSEEYTVILPKGKDASDFDLTVECNAKFKGKILNELLMDEYGDISGKTEMFSVEKVENVIPADELTEESSEELPF